MKITYDPWADAVYFRLADPEKVPVDYTDVDGDTFIHYTPDKRIAALEVLAASQRLDLDFLLPEITLLGNNGYKTWRKREEIVKTLWTLGQYPADSP